MMPFHSGEIAVQTRAGVREDAEQISRVISNTIKPAALEFLRTQQIAIASTVAADGRIWADLLTGSPGFVQVLNEHTVQINLFSEPSSGDDCQIQNYMTHSLHQNLHSHSQIGLLVIDLSNRKRLRLNGKVMSQQPEMIQIQIQQSFFNCPKYIQTRYLETTAIETLQPREIQTRNAINEADWNWIIQADTFFIASAHPEYGADASHRGGYPGFVQVTNSQTLLFPDYAGNNMFQTLGNLAINLQASLLFINFEQGHALQLTGKAKILWDTERLAAFAGAQRLVEFSIERVRETRNATPFRWRFGEYSPANPQSDPANTRYGLTGRVRSCDR